MFHLVGPGGKWKSDMFWKNIGVAPRSVKVALSCPEVAPLLAKVAHKVDTVR